MKAVIFGAGGQDGTILSMQLKESGHQVIPVRKGDRMDPLQSQEVPQFILNEKPDQIYYLAASHRSSETQVLDPEEEWGEAYRVHLTGWLKVLDACRTKSPLTKLLYASSAHIFGKPSEVPQNEETPFRPTCPYGSSKYAGMQAGMFYRSEYGLHVSHAILFPHESIYRPSSFLSKKLLEAVVESKKRPSHKIRIGDLSATSDWGYAPEYTLAMQKILSLPDGQELVVATGIEHSVADFAQSVFETLGLDWTTHIESQTNLLTKPKRRYLGDPSKLAQCTGHRCGTTLPELGRRLLLDLGVGR